MLTPMIHDFATAPRTPREPARAVASTLSDHKSNRRLPVVVMLGVITAIGVWLIRSPGAAGTLEETQYPIAAAKTEYLQAASTEQNLLAGPEPVSSVTTEPVALDQSVPEREPLGAQDVDQHLEESYEFYDSLQASSWSVPVQRGIYLTEEDRKRAEYRYILQAASLRDRSEAAALAAKLRKMGLEASYSVSNGDPNNSAWYRVNVGPFSNVSVMNKAEDMLVSMQMMPLKRRVR